MNWSLAATVHSISLINRQRKQQEKMSTMSTTVPVKDVNSPEYLAIQSNCSDLKLVLDDPVNKSDVLEKLFQAKMIPAMASESTSGKNIVDTVLEVIRSDAMKFYKFLAVLQYLSTGKYILERIHEAFLCKSVIILL